MTITVTQRISEQSALAATHTTASFTPTASSILYVWAVAQTNNTTSTKAWSISNTGGLSFAILQQPPDRDWNGNTAFRTQGTLWTANVGASPSSMTVTVDAQNPGSDTYNYAIIIFDVTPNTVSTIQSNSASEQDGGGDSETISVTMSQAIQSGNTAICMLGAGNDGSATFTLPTGFSTSLANQSAVNCKAAASYGTAVTSTTVTCTDLGSLIGNSCIAVVELSETAPPTPRFLRPTQSTIRLGS